MFPNVGLLEETRGGGKEKRMIEWILYLYRNMAQQNVLKIVEQYSVRERGKKVI
jgi:hypothetical protein